MLTRRSFLGAAALTALSYSRVLGAAEQLRVAAVGVGGRGWSDLTGAAAAPQVQIAAVCDVDESKEHLGRAATQYASARRLTDWRKLLDQSKTFDAVVVGTPDHAHAPIALPMMQLGKHVYCEKPLTHTVFEARQMRLAARKNKVVTQMGNQIQSHPAYRTAVKMVHDGAIGKVKEVRSWQAGKMYWILVDDRPEGADPIPKTLAWDEWLGVAPLRPYKERIYHPFNWRAWQDFSTGQIGDFACHILDPVFNALELTAPKTIRAEAPPINREIWTKKNLVEYVFPGTKRTAGETLKLTWRDGDGHLPPIEGLGLPAGHKLPGSGSVLVGEKGTMLLPHVGMPRVYLSDGSELKSPPEEARDHHAVWVNACRGTGTPGSNFEYAGMLTEAVLLGSIAIRVPETTLSWSAEDMKLTGSEKAAGLLRKEYRKGWEPSWIS